MTNGLNGLQKPLTEYTAKGNNSELKGVLVVDYKVFVRVEQNEFLEMQRLAEIGTAVELAIEHNLKWVLSYSGTETEMSFEDLERLLEWYNSQQLKNE